MDRYRKIQWDLISEQVIEAALITAFFAVPLVVLPNTYELFEFNKIILVYALASILLIFGLIKGLTAERPRLVRPQLLTIGLIFLGILALSTLTSIDKQVSLFGFYGRFHGGLFSYLAYGIIYFSLTQLPARSYLNLIKVSLFSGFLVAAWGILEHYGIDASYWAQDVRARVFSTLGHPNWLGAYLAMLLPRALGLCLTARKNRDSIIFAALALLFYTCFIFTYSRGASLGLIAAILTFLVLIGGIVIKENLKKLLVLLFGVIMLTLSFASTVSPQVSGTTPRALGTLESGNETGNIRLIVWQGAVDVFKKYPILGSGPETFGESFYQHRPISLNYTGEWNFLFNKAHNEYLNSLATTGILGTVAYILLFATFLWNIFRVVKKLSREKRVYLAAAAGSTVGFLVQNTFGFTVVPLAVLAVLNLADLVLVKQGFTRFSLPKNPYPKLIAPILLAPLGLSLILVFNFWRADTYYSQGLGAFDLGDYQSAERLLSQAVELNSFEPNYLIQLAYVRSFLAKEVEGSRIDLISSSVDLGGKATAISPLNLSIWRTWTQILQQLGNIDASYKKQARGAMERTVEIAPTEAEVRLELAQFYEISDDEDLALKAYLETIGLKNDLLEPLISVTRIYLKRGDLKQAKIYLERARELAPKDPAVIELSQKVNQ